MFRFIEGMFITVTGFTGSNTNAIPLKCVSTNEC